jgi:hypothetical protein
MSDSNIYGGYILLSRKIIEGEIWRKPPLYLKVWLYLLIQARHRDYKNLQRGQVVTSISELQEVCGWYVGYRKEKPTKDQVYQVIDWMRTASKRSEDETVHETKTMPVMITTTKVTHGLLITIENYGFYQQSRNYESNVEDNSEANMEATSEQRQPANINKNEKNERLTKERRRPNEVLSSLAEVVTFVENSAVFNLSLAPQNLIIRYIDTLRLGRKTARISTRVMQTLWEKFARFPATIVTYAIQVHVEKHDDKREEYTLGIMRGTSEHEANQRLMRKTDEAIGNEKEGGGDDHDATAFAKGIVRSSKDQSGHRTDEGGKSYYDQYRGLFADKV